MTYQIAALTHLPHAAPHDNHKPVTAHAKPMMAAAAAAPMVVKNKVLKR
jgi:hypothetical protein